VIIIDDGSPNGRKQVAFDFVRKYKLQKVRVVLLGKNQGNGEAGMHMGLLDFIKTADPRKVRAVEVQKGDDQVTLLESTRNCFMPLVIPAAGGSSSVAATN
ncbi:hypothetical protein Tco_1179847, partial [Tanacetum coccineum]